MGTMKVVLKDEELPGLKSKLLQITETCRNCSDSPKSVGAMGADFDKVQVNY